MADHHGGDSVFKGNIGFFLPNHRLLILLGLLLPRSLTIIVRAPEAQQHIVERIQQTLHIVPLLEVCQYVERMHEALLHESHVSDTGMRVHRVFESLG